MTMQMKVSRVPYYSSSLRELYSASTFSGSFRTLHLWRPVDVWLETKTFLDLLIVKEVVLDREYETNGVTITSRDRVIVDIGAGLGEFVITTAKKFPKAKIYAVEIDPDYIRLLKKNIARNAITSIQVVEKPIHSLATFMRQVGGTIDFLKIDCEGCEYPLLRTASPLTLTHIKKISMEYHEFGGMKKETIRSALEKTGFTVRTIPIPATPGTGHLVAQRSVQKYASGVIRR
jgi:hypothetical protein